MAASSHPSSDEFKDDDMADAFVEMSKHDHPPNPIPLNYQKTSGTTQPDDDCFETAPTTPPPSKRDSVGLGIGLDEQVRDSRSFSSPKPKLGAIDNKKRPCSGAEPMNPPPMRGISREKCNVQSDLKYAVPTPHLDGYGSMSRPLDLSRSFDNISSISSSMTSVSPAWTTPNTSFCSDSLAKSLDFTAEETDTTVRPSFGQFRSRYSSDQSSLWSVRDSKDGRQTGSNVSLGPALPAPDCLPTRPAVVEPNIDASSAMDLDMTDVAMPSMERQGGTSPSMLTNLAKRLISQSPFGISIPFIVFTLVSR